MNQDPFALPEHKEGLEADAVCGQCGNVNPEGTLICKTCGNNLRDQRQLRLAADQMLDAEGESGGGSQFLARALPVLGLLILLWFGLNAGRIASMLTTADVPGPETSVYAQPAALWTDASSNDVFERLQQELQRQFPSASDAESARLNSASMDGWTSGRYALFERLGTGMRFAGAVMIQFDNNRCQYAGVLTPDIEIRGTATLLNDAYVSHWDEAGALHEDEFYALSGVAMLQPDGSVSISGHSDYSLRRYQAVAYRLGGI